jgi:hypothetical protein
MGNFEVQRNVQYICLELLLSFVNDMAARASDVGFESHRTYISTLLISV